jgi:hypothetical protein
MGAEDNGLHFGSSLGKSQGELKKLVTAIRNIEESVIITDATRKIVFVRGSVFEVHLPTAE